MKKLKVEHFTSAGFRPVELSKVCKVSEACVCIWKIKGFIPLKYKGLLSKMVKRREAKIDNLYDRLSTPKNPRGKYKLI